MLIHQSCIPSIQQILWNLKLMLILCGLERRGTMSVGGGRMRANMLFLLTPISRILLHRPILCFYNYPNSFLLSEFIPSNSLNNVAVVLWNDLSTTDTNIWAKNVESIAVTFHYFWWSNSLTFWNLDHKLCRASAKELRTQTAVIKFLLLEL